MRCMEKGFFSLLLLGVIFCPHSGRAEEKLVLNLDDEDSSVQDTSNQNDPNILAKDGLDKNMDYGEVYRHTELEALPKPIQQEALGTRAYRPSLVAVGYGERVPGYGIFGEFSFNRIALGIASSLQDLDAGKQSNTSVLDKFSTRIRSFNSLYASYRWIPMAVSPYILFGVGLVNKSDTNIGVLSGLGIEAEVYYGLNFIIGYTYFTAVKKGYAGGSLAWAF